MLPRERYEQAERMLLSDYAARSVDTKGRDRAEEPCDYRTEYQRDRARILHCKSFRRLKHKTQVFLSPEGDHYRTRLTHTLEVAQIARTIARALQLNEDLTEAISLGHDLGHTPFGHAGERALNRLMENGFRHFEQSVRVVEKLEKDGKGLNLTWEVRNGILCHTRGEEAATLEGRIVRLADKIAYINHDLDDAARAHLLDESDIPADIRKVLGGRRTERIDNMVRSVVENSGDDIRMDPQTTDCFERLHAFMYESLYTNSIAKSEEFKVDGLVAQMFAHLLKNPDLLPREFAVIREQEGVARAACDYIAGMTDNYALQMVQEWFVPHGWSIPRI